MNNTILASQGMTQRSSMMGSWMLSWLGGSWIRCCGELYQDARILCAEREKRYTSALYSSAGFGDLNEEHNGGD